MMDHNLVRRPLRGLAADNRVPGLRAPQSQRLERTARIEPQFVLGVVEFWLAEAGLEGVSRDDT